MPAYRRRLSEFTFQVTIAVVGGLLVAAAIGAWVHFTSNSDRVHTSRASQSANVIHNRHPSLSPSVSVSPRLRGKASASASPGVETPANQPGYSFLWNKIVVVGLTGVTFQDSGPEQGNGSDDYTLEYNTVSSTGWNSNDPFFFNLPASLTPGPATCVAMFNQTASLPYVNGVAVNGAHYCDVETAINLDPTLVIYAQVLKVARTSVTLDVWAWK
jgi:hypothetical protein